MEKLHKTLDDIDVSDLQLKENQFVSKYIQTGFTNEEYVALRLEAAKSKVGMAKLIRRKLGYPDLADRRNGPAMGHDIG